MISAFALSSWSRVGKTAPVTSGSLASCSAGTAFVRNEILVPDRVAVALQPEVLALVGVQELLPELGGVRMRRVGADRLDVDAGEPDRLRDDDLDLRTPLAAVLSRFASAL